MVQGGSELAASQTREWNLNRGLATDLQNSLESMRSTEMHALLDVIGSIHNQLVSGQSWLEGFQNADLGSVPPMSLFL